MDLRIGTTIYLNNEFLEKYTSKSKSSYGFEIVALTDGALRLKNLRSKQFYTLAISRLTEFISYPDANIKRPSELIYRKVYTPVQKRINTSGTALVVGYKPLVINSMVVPSNINVNSAAKEYVDYTATTVGEISISGSALTTSADINIRGNNLGTLMCNATIENKTIKLVGSAQYSFTANSATTTSTTDPFHNLYG